jgi:hypothetical protein
MDDHKWLALFVLELRKWDCVFAKRAISERHRSGSGCEWEAKSIFSQKKSSLDFFGSFFVKKKRT